MKHVNFFYFAEGVRELERIEVDVEATLATVKGAIIGKHGLATECFLFLEDDDEPVDETKHVGSAAGAAGVKGHVHRCTRIEVGVTFNGKTIEHRFGPGTTIAKVKAWAADEFKISKEEAGEHVLQLSGTHEQPAPGTHIGALAKCPDCKISFDLLPKQRVNGCGVLP